MMGHGHPGVRSRVALVGAGVALAALLIVVALQFDTGRQAPEPELGEVIDLLPGPLTEGEMDGRAFDGGAGTRMPVLEAGGWIQIVDPDTGRLSQQYRFERLDPNPPGSPPDWVQMDHPRAEIYMDNDRVISLAGDSALVHLPHRVLESGTISGNVTIRAYETPAGRRLDEKRDRPVLVVHTTKADFDNVIGEVRCPDKFRIETPSLEFAGRALSLLINDQAERVLPSVEVEHVEFARFSRVEPAAPRPDSGVSRAGGRPRLAAAPARAAAGFTIVPAVAQAAGTRPPQFYRLTLRDHVRVQEGVGRRFATGDVMTVLFSTESEGLGPSLAATPGPAPRPASRGTLYAQLALAGLALPGPAADRPLSIAPPLREDDVYVTCTGGLTMIPVDDAGEIETLKSPRDSEMTLVGAPVELLDRPRDARATCDRLVYHAQEERVELLGSDEHPLQFQAPQLAAGGERFWMAGAQGGFTGPGWISAPQRRRPADAPQLIGELPGGALAPPGEPEVRVTWTDGLDLEFDKDGAAADAGPGDLGTLTAATFRGEVEATSEQGTVAADELDIDLERGDDGRPVPRLATASGDVRAADDGQTLWADRAVVTFRDAPAAAPATDGEPGLGAAQVDLESATAEGDVQVLLGNGARVFADRLIGDAGNQTAELLGADIAIARGQWLLDRGHRVTLSRAAGTAHWDGSGTARMYADALPLAVDGRVDRAAFGADAQVNASWRQAMHYDGGAGEAGEVEMTGGVRLVSTPDPLRETRFAAESVTIGLAPGAEQGAAGAFEQERGLGRVIANGAASLDHRDWLAADHADEPRIFFVKGDRIEYDHRSGEALVPGPGELLIRDLRDDPGEEGAERGGDADGRLAARGTTSFRWRQKLMMTRRAGTLYDIVMLDDVEMRHLDLDQAASSLTCDWIEATIDRAEDARAQAGDRGPGEVAGAAKLVRLQAAGDVFLRTPARDVDCDLFAYDVRSGLADLAADPGAMVTIYNRGLPQPVQVQRAEWDLVTDRIRVLSGAAGTTR